MTAVAVYLRGPKKDACCGRCQWWQPQLLRDQALGEETRGECRCRPPHSAHGWPGTYGTDWCGAFRAAQVDTPAERRLVPTGSEPRVGDCGVPVDA